MVLLRNAPVQVRWRALTYSAEPTAEQGHTRAANLLI
jgi:hypothetical protein